jgi:riboflavin kinase/FMN adenylyltransferase
MTIISHLLEKASELRGESVVLTLWPHPRLFLKKDIENFRLLNALEEKQILLEKQHIDHLVVLPFNEETQQMSPSTFIEEILIRRIGVKHLLIGYDHHFGKGGRGNIEDIKNYSRKHNFQVERVEAQKTENGKEISSSIIREALWNGKLEEANKYLGYNYLLKGQVVGGHRIGGKIGFPTANIEIPEPYKLIPKDGVYAIKATIGKKKLQGMLNIGYRPTVDNHGYKKSIEAHLFDFNEDIYGKEIIIHLIARLRDEQRFENVEALIKQLKKDRSESLRILEEKKNQ